MKQVASYTAHALSVLSGVSVRTLHYYDELGLLQPRRAGNNYRVYTDAEIDRLQQILLYRAVGLKLSAIKGVLDGDGFDAQSALENHLCALRKQQDETNKLIANVEKTLACMKGETKMSDTEKFEGFKKKLIEDNEKRYGEEVRAAYGDAAIDASNAKVAGMNKQQWEASQQLEDEFKAALLRAMETGDVAGETAQQACDLHRQWLCQFWAAGTYSPEAHKALGEGYVADERFKSYYDAVAPGAAEFLRDALAVYCA
ncbi:MAG: MerR family transcriptional regulator [Raoultibacter sp.]